MLAAFADHLWQSLLFCALCAALSWSARCNSAVVRLWLWRLCALKLLLPFSLPFALGGWVGWPAYHSADLIPGSLVHTSDLLTPLFAPVRSARVGAWVSTLCLVVLLPAAALFVPHLLRALVLERARAHGERLRVETDPDDVPPGLGFWKGMLFACCAVSVFSGVVMAGAIADRRWRQDLILTHARALRGAPITMTEAAPGMGGRSRIDAQADGILIRNISIQDLVAIAYGVNHYAVWGNQMISADDPEARAWLVDPHYDLHIRARIVQPEDFDSYALRPLLTKYLADRFGYEIYINGRCQPPCGTYNVAMPMDEHL